MPVPAHLIGKTILDRQKANEAQAACTCVYETVETFGGDEFKYIEYMDPQCPTHHGQVPESVEVQLHPQDSNLPRSG